MIDEIINIFYFLIGAVVGAVFVWLLIRNQVESAVKKKDIKIAQLESGIDTEENIKNRISEIADSATKPVIAEFTAARDAAKNIETANKIKEAEIKRKEDAHDEKLRKQETRDQYDTSIRSVNAQRKMEDIINNMGFVEPQMVEFRKKQAGINGLPDATLKFPFGRKLMCDSKAPLEYFDELFEAGKNGDDGKVTEIKKKIARAIKKHIDDLNKASYFNADGAFPYVIMFLPTERILSIVRELGNLFSNKDIDTYARENNIIISGPSTFYPQVENIKVLWQEFKNTQNTNKVLDIVNNSFNSMRIVIDKVVTFNKSFNTTIDAAKGLNTSIFTTLGNAAKKAKDLGFSDENVIKILDEDGQSKEKEFSKIDERK